MHKLSEVQFCLGKGQVCSCNIFYSSSGEYSFWNPKNSLHVCKSILWTRSAALAAHRRINELMSMWLAADSTWSSWSLVSLLTNWSHQVLAKRKWLGMGEG